MFKFKQYVEDVENFELDEDEQSEATKSLSFATRAKMKRNAIKNRNKLKLGARRQKKKIASLNRLKKRARRAARRAFAKKNVKVARKMDRTRKQGGAGKARSG